MVALAACTAGGSIGGSSGEPEDLDTTSSTPDEGASKGGSEGSQGGGEGGSGGGGVTLRGRPAVVVRVVDGDTIEADLSGRVIAVRLIGVDTPETVHPFEPVGCFGPEASRFTDRALEGERVRLEFDLERTDRYGRTLAYVWVGHRLFNRTLVRRGFGTVSIYPPNDRYEARLRAAQRRARSREAGLWGSCPVGAARGDGTEAGRCDPSYPGVCIPTPPPDLDCADVPFDHFVVVGSDPHHFDGDHDGVGCET